MSRFRSVSCLQRESSGTVRGVRHGASRRTRFRNPLDFKWISDFRMDFWISGFQSGFLDFWISKWISGFQSGFLDFKVDFWISKWISGFQSGFLDFKVDFSRDFWISSEFLERFLDFKRISGFQSGFLDFQSGFLEGFLDFKRISGFHLNRYYSKIELKYTHDSSTAFLSACMLTEYKVTGTSPLHSAQAACSLIVIHIRIL